MSSVYKAWQTHKKMKVFFLVSDICIIQFWNISVCTLLSVFVNYNQYLLTVADLFSHFLKEETCSNQQKFSTGIS